APARAGFSFLAQRRGDFHQGGTIRTDEWAPDRYRATLLDGFAGERPPMSWPWTDLKPTDFAAAPDPNAMPTPTPTLPPPAQPKLFPLALPPLLPDETK